MGGKVKCNIAVRCTLLSILFGVAIKIIGALHLFYVARFIQKQIIVLRVQRIRDIYKKQINIRYEVQRTVISIFKDPET